MCLFPCTSSLIFPQTFCSEALRSLISRTGPPPQSTFASLFLLPWTFRSEARLPGVSSLIATSPPRVHLYRCIPSACYVPSSGFLNLSTVCSAVRLASLFHLAATSRVLSRSGGSLLVQPFFPHRKEWPPCRFARVRSPTEVSCHFHAPRLRGFALHEAALPTARFYPPRRSLPSSGSCSLRALVFALRFGSPLRATHDVALLDLRLRGGLARPSSAFFNDDPDSRYLYPESARSKLSGLLHFPTEVGVRSEAPLRICCSAVSLPCAAHN